MASLKEHGVTISISTIATLLPVLAIMWVFVKPALVASVSVAVADDLDDQIEDQVAPIQGAFKVLIISNVNELKKEIAALRFREEHEPETWTAEDAEELTGKEIELLAFEEANDKL